MSGSTIEPGRLPILGVEDNAADAFAFERALAGTRYQLISVRRVADAKRVLERVSLRRHPAGYHAGGRGQPGACSSI